MSENLMMKYFVLKPKGNDLYAEASRKAMLTYADFIRMENSALADDLIAWSDKEQMKSRACGYPPIPAPEEKR